MSERGPIPQGIAFFPSLLSGPALIDWNRRIDIEYERLGASCRASGPGAASQLVRPGQRFVPTASSLTLGAVLADHELLSLLVGIGDGSAGAWIRNELGPRNVCDLDQAWLRRQYALSHYPAFHAPHGWHQDGALGFDFLAHPDGSFPRNAMLPMITCWIALAPCGAEAPGLEFAKRRFEDLLGPAELRPERVSERFAPECWHPVMETGDALLFPGDILHRTYVTPTMTQDRTSIELRFFPAGNIPARLNGDRFIPLV